MKPALKRNTVHAADAAESGILRICFRGISFVPQDVPSLPLDEIALAEFSARLAKEIIKKWPKELETAVERQSTCILFYGNNKRRSFIPSSVDEETVAATLSKMINMLTKSGLSAVPVLSTQRLSLI